MRPSNQLSGDTGGGTGSLQHGRYESERAKEVADQARMAQRHAEAQYRVGANVASPSPKEPDVQRALGRLDHVCAQLAQGVETLDVASITVRSKGSGVEISENPGESCDTPLAQVLHAYAARLEGIDNYLRRIVNGFEL